ncbi:hypothetical protein CAL7716_106710 (plasmid) [Calothrix sp. PCC 7716]|nr:hypothetical protein CAL7716_106710 [Calothrix sp. PCC 7716]
MAIEESAERSDANSRLLKQRARATVPTRDTRVIKTQPTEHSNEFNSTPPTISLEVSKEDSALSREPQPDVATTISSKLATFTLRVDDKVDKGLKSLCTIENISKETFLEAAYLVCMENQEFMQQVLSIATARKQERRSAGIQRRAKAMTRYLQDW